jgi:hypothetical protein
MGFSKKHFFKSSFYKASDLTGAPQTLTITSVGESLVGPEKQHRCIVYFDESDLGLVLNATNYDALASAFGDDTDAWTGKRIGLVRAIVAFQGKQVPAIRVRIPKTAQVVQAAPPQGGANDEDLEPEWDDTGTDD